MKFYHCDRFTFPLPDGHRFPIRKYGLLRERIEQTRLVPAQNGDRFRFVTEIAPLE